VCLDGTSVLEVIFRFAGGRVVPEGVATREMLGNQERHPWMKALGEPEKIA